MLLNDAAMTLTDRLEACECFMVGTDDLGLVFDSLAETVRCAIAANQSQLANELLVILEREIQRMIFHDYIDGEYRDEVERRVAVLRLAKEH